MDFLPSLIPTHLQDFHHFFQVKTRRGQNELVINYFRMTISATEWISGVLGNLLVSMASRYIYLTSARKQEPHPAWSIYHMSAEHIEEARQLTTLHTMVIAALQT